MTFWGPQPQRLPMPEFWWPLLVTQHSWLQPELLLISKKKYKVCLFTNYSTYDETVLKISRTFYVFNYMLYYQFIETIMDTALINNTTGILKTVIWDFCQYETYVRSLFLHCGHHVCQSTIFFNAWWKVTSSVEHNAWLDCLGNLHNQRNQGHYNSQ